MDRKAEVLHKLHLVQDTLHLTGAGAVRLRGTDWFAWLTAGGSSAVLQTLEEGCAEVFITPQDCLILTDEIEAERLIAEELPAGLDVKALPWADVNARSQLIQACTGNRMVLSDRPRKGETDLPAALKRRKQSLIQPEIERYRILGRHASEAMTDAVSQVHPQCTEWEVAALVSHLLRKRGLDVGLVQVAGEHRSWRFRHALPQDVPFGQRGIISLCARRWGLWVSLSRMVSFQAVSEQELLQEKALQDIESEIFQASRVGSTLGELYEVARLAYQRQGFSRAIQEHHQGGTTGYACRDLLALPKEPSTLQANTALAWNPSLKGSKIEDTLLLHADNTLEVLTHDLRWPSVLMQGLYRPGILQLDLQISSPEALFRR